MEISVKVQIMSHEVENFEADTNAKIPTFYSVRKRQTYLKHRSDKKYFQMSALKKGTLDKAIKYKTQVITIHDFLKEACIVVDETGRIIAIEQPVGVLSLGHDLRIFKVISETSNVKVGHSYWSFLDHIGDRVYVLNCSHKQKIQFEIFDNKEERDRLYDMIASGFAKYSERRRLNGNLLE